MICLILKAISELCTFEFFDSIKDYYKILRVEKNAPQEEIKKSYRVLAHHFHPDKNQDNTFATEYFLEIQEAYEVLSSPAARHAYDRERRIAGMDRSNEVFVTPQALLRQAQKLAEDVRRMTAYRIDIPWLNAAVVYLLSNQHLAILTQPGLLPLRHAFLKEVIAALKGLHFPYEEAITTAVTRLVVADVAAKREWDIFFADQKRKYIFQKAVPWFAVFITIGLCLLMYWYGNK